MQSVYKKIEPQSEGLKSLIKLYYIHQSNDDNAVEKITYYPNFVTTINVYQGSSVTWDAFSRTHEKTCSEDFLKLLVGKFDKSRQIHLKGSYNKLSIVFHPLGLNHFIDLPLSKLVQPHFSFFNYFGKSFDKIFQDVFEEDDMEEKRDILDEYFRSRLLGFFDDRLSYAVDQIMKNSEISMKAISDELNISRKTLLRLFKKHLAQSPTDFKLAVKFRRALNIYQARTRKANLSQLAYEARFYDQSDLNYHFKVKTGLSPRQLFATLHTIEKGLYWKVDYVPKVQ